MAVDKPSFEAAREEIAAKVLEERMRAERARSLLGMVEKGGQRAVEAERLLWEMGLGGFVTEWKKNRKKNK